MRVEWPTLMLILGCYGIWASALFLLPEISLTLSILVAAVMIALQSSLQHEVLHGHPFADRRFGEFLVFPSLNLAIPYIRFRDMHLSHHMDATLTDPYDDPESNYWDPVAWGRAQPWQRALYTLNNTLLGRMVLGPAISQVAFAADELHRVRAAEPGIAAAWVWHGVTAGAVLMVVAMAAMPVWAYLAACYLGLSLLKIRTFLEHQAHMRARGRTVIIEDRGPLAFLFLNNNLHVVHHMHPRLPWYRLPAIYFNNRDKYLARNGGYSYASYAEIFRRYLLRSKDPVPHPLYPPN